MQDIGNIIKKLYSQSLSFDMSNDQWNSWKNQSLETILAGFNFKGVAI